MYLCSAKILFKSSKSFGVYANAIFEDKRYFFLFLQLRVVSGDEKMCEENDLRGRRLSNGQFLPLFRLFQEYWKMPSILVTHWKRTKLEEISDKNDLCGPKEIGTPRGRRINNKTSNDWIPHKIHIVVISGPTALFFRVAHSFLAVISWQRALACLSSRENCLRKLRCFHSNKQFVRLFISVTLFGIDRARIVYIIYAE